MISIGQSFVVDAKQVQNGGVEVVDVDSVFANIHAEVVRPSVPDSDFHPDTGPPPRKGIFVMLSAGASPVILDGNLP